MALLPYPALGMDLSSRPSMHTGASARQTSTQRTSLLVSPFMAYNAEMTDSAQLTQLNSPDASQRLATLAGLHLLPPEAQSAATPDVLPLLADPDADVRWAAASLLHASWSRSYPHTRLQSISARLRDADTDTVLGALQQLSRYTVRRQFDDQDECDISAHIPEVCVLLYHSSDEVQQQAIKTLGDAKRSHTCDAALPVLFVCLEQAKTDLQARIISVICGLNSPDVEAVIARLGGAARLPTLAPVLHPPLIRLMLQEARQDLVARMVSALHREVITTLLDTLEKEWNTALEPVLSEALSARAPALRASLQLQLRCLLVRRCQSQTPALPAFLSSLLGSLSARTSLKDRRRVVKALGERAYRIKGLMTKRSALSQTERVQRWDLLQPAVPLLLSWLDEADEELCAASGRILRELLFDCDPAAFADLLSDSSDTAFSGLGAEIDFEHLEHAGLYDALEARSLPVARQQIQEVAASGAQTINLGWQLGPKRPLMVLPPEVAQLTTLTTLNLPRQQLRTLPPEIGALKALQELDVSSNPLQDLPPEIGALTALRELNISKTTLPLLPDAIGQLASLSILRATDGALLRLPETLCDLPALQRLEVSSAALAALPEGLGRLPALVYLSVCGALQELPESICQLKSLNALYVLSPLQRLPDGFSTLPLEHLTLKGLDHVPDAVLEMESLVSLDLSYGSLTEVPEALAQLPNLDLLNVTGCGVQDYPDALLERHAAGLTLWPQPR